MGNWLYYRWQEAFAVSGTLSVTTTLEYVSGRMKKLTAERIQSNLKQD